MKTVIGATVLVGLILFAGLAWLSHKENVACEQKGGETVSVYKGRLCVSKDGRILR